MSEKPIARPGAGRLLALSNRFKRDDNGATAIEFAIVLGPFLAFTFGIITIGLHYLSTNSLEKAVYDASRQIRTGQAQQSGMTSKQFASLVCSLSSPHLDCNKLRVHISSYDSWKDVAPPDCVDNDTHQLSNGNSGNTPITNDVGGASKKVLVTVCYDWTIAKYLPFLLHDDHGNSRFTSPLSSGGMLMQASAIFQTEPYE
ncbi:MAG TPA: pilus assembly protein [Hyphomicrobiaceae bacterium]|nr:pilus assembly protein [Hyphomicrobiaceae bacterium]